MQHTTRDWRHRAVCRDEDPELFWPVATVGPDYDKQVSEAKRICHRCSVAQNCLAFALESGQVGGIWGGMGEDARRALRQNLKHRTVTV